MLSRGTLLTRNVLNRFVRKSHDHHDFGGIAGSNLPFDITNKFKLTAMFMVYFGSGFAAPFLILRHQLLKK